MWTKNSSWIPNKPQPSSAISLKIHHQISIYENVIRFSQINQKDGKALAFSIFSGAHAYKTTNYLFTHTLAFCVCKCVSESRPCNVEVVLVECTKTHKHTQSDFKNRIRLKRAWAQYAWTVKWVDGNDCNTSKWAKCALFSISHRWLSHWLFQIANRKFRVFFRSFSHGK